MNPFIKGILLGVSLNIASLLCGYSTVDFSDNSVYVISAIVFGIIITLFLISQSIQKLLICGFTGLFTMFFGEILCLSTIFPSHWRLEPYIAGLDASVFAIAAAVIITVKKIKLSDFTERKCNGMCKELKIKLMIYTLISAISFSYLVLPEYAGISVPLFALLQFAMLWYIAPDKKKLVLFIPVFVMSLNCFISANTIWRASNILVSILLFGCMFTDINFKSDTFDFIVNMVLNSISAITHYSLPFKWTLELTNDKAPVIKRGGIALLIAIPCAIILISVLANADMVFSLKTSDFIESLSQYISINTIVKIVLGLMAGLYLFGVIYNAHCDKDETYETKKQYRGDLIIINILLITILIIYTAFVVIQFKYLFAGYALPEGLTYTEYARKGFFELLALTGVNIALILTSIKLTKTHSGKWIGICKILCHYLCAVTIVLLISSFYRMFLYTNDDGLTRLRFFVMGFLLFEAIGLIITFIYIAKPKFNLIMVYTLLALTYYSVLNLVPADSIIAKNQINKYLRGEREDIDYVFTLSADAVQEVKKLYKQTNDDKLKQRIEYFIKTKTEYETKARWQRYNLAVERAKK